MAKVFVALIIFYELRTSRITELNTMGAATVSSSTAAFLSRLANLQTCDFLSNAWLVDLQASELSHSLTLMACSA